MPIKSPTKATLTTWSGWDGAAPESPERKQREALKIGDRVYLLWELDQPIEVWTVKGPGETKAGRAWVTVTAIREDGTFIGKTRGYPAVISGFIHNGDPVEFSACHVQAVIPK